MTTTTTRFRADIYKLRTGEEDELVGSVEDTPHFVAQYLSVMAKKVKREAALMDEQAMMADQPSLLTHIEEERKGQ